MGISTCTVNKANSRLVELWQENCEQPLEHDNAMADKDNEVKRH